MCFNYDGYCDVWEEKQVKIRKPHKCCECGKEIQPGATMQCVRSLYDHEWNTDYTCERCQRLRKLVTDEEIARGCYVSDATPALGDLYEALCEGRYEHPELKVESMR